MRAIQVGRYGGPEVLGLEEVQVPEPGPGQVRVRIMAAGVNFIDIYQRRGDYPVPLPYIPGREGSGVVDSAGEGAQRFKPGDRVAYYGSVGTYAEFIVVKEDALIPLHQELSFQQGAAFPLQGMTAHYLLHEYRSLEPLDVVLIHAAAGGVGLLLVQWARRMGARVIGTVSTEAKAQAACAAGADDIILYTKQDFPSAVMRLTDGNGADLILDGVGKTTFPGNLEAVALRGHIIIYGSASGPANPISPNVLMGRSITVAGGSLISYIRNREELLCRATAVSDAIRAGWLQLRIDHQFPLAEVSEAHFRLENRSSIGKVLLACTA